MSSVSDAADHFIIAGRDLELVKLKLNYKLFGLQKADFIARITVSIQGSKGHYQGSQANTDMLVGAMKSINLMEERPNTTNTRLLVYFRSSTITSKEDITKLVRSYKSI